MISADLLYECRRRAGISQAELARRVGRSQAQIARWERGAVEPSLETLRALVRACGLELGFRLAVFDESYVPYIERYLALSPAERVAGAVARANALRRVRRPVEAARRA